MIYKTKNDYSLPQGKPQLPRKIDLRILHIENY